MVAEFAFKFPPLLPPLLPSSPGSVVGGGLVEPGVDWRGPSVVPVDPDPEPALGPEPPEFPSEEPDVPGVLSLEGPAEAGVEPPSDDVVPPEDPPSEVPEPPAVPDWDEPNELCPVPPDGTCPEPGVEPELESAIRKAYASVNRTPADASIWARSPAARATRNWPMVPRAASSDGEVTGRPRAKATDRVGPGRWSVATPAAATPLVASTPTATAAATGWRSRWSPAQVAERRVGGAVSGAKGSTAARPSRSAVSSGAPARAARAWCRAAITSGPGTTGSGARTSPSTSKSVSSSNVGVMTRPPRTGPGWCAAGRGPGLGRCERPRDACPGWRRPRRSSGRPPPEARGARGRGRAAG